MTSSCGVFTVSRNGAYLQHRVGEALGNHLIPLLSKLATQQPRGEGCPPGGGRAKAEDILLLASLSGLGVGVRGQRGKDRGEVL